MASREKKNPKRAGSCILDPENFGILNGTKHTHKKLVFYILSF